MKGLSVREKSLLAVLGLAVVFYLYYSFFFKPIMGKAETLKASVDKYQIQVDKIRNAASIIEKQKTQLGELKVKLLEVLKVMPDRERNPEISLNIKTLAINNGAAVTSINFGQPLEYKPEAEKPKSEGSTDAAQGSEQNKDGQNGAAPAQPQQPAVQLTVVPVTVAATGNYNQIMNFVSALEKDRRIAQVGTAALSLGQDGKLTGNIGVMFFYSGGVNEDPTSYDFNDGRTDGKADLFK